jgi:hypothetical protein
LRRHRRGPIAAIKRAPPSQPASEPRQRGRTRNYAGARAARDGPATRVPAYLGQDFRLQNESSTTNAINCHHHSHGDNEHLAARQSQGIRRFPSQDWRLQQCQRVRSRPGWEDQKRQTQENLEALLLEATRSGPGREFTKADCEALRRELAKRLAKRSSK